MRTLKSLEEEFNQAKKLVGKDKKERSLARRSFYLWRDKAHKKIQDRGEETAEQKKSNDVATREDLLGLIEQYRTANEYDELKYLSYKIVHALKDANVNINYSDEITALRKVLYAPFSESSDIVQVLITLLAAHPDISVTNTPKLPPLDKRNTFRPEVPHWQGKSELNPDDKGDELVDIDHGGGYFHILEFLTGKSPGYLLEQTRKTEPGFGIQVTPSKRTDRDGHYAVSAAARNCDLPGILKAKIKRKYLDEAKLLYEAGLRQQFIDLLEEVTLTRLTPENVCAKYWSISPELAKIEFSKNFKIDISTAEFERNKLVMNYIATFNDKPIDLHLLESAFEVASFHPLQEADIKTVLESDSSHFIEFLFNKIKEPNDKVRFLKYAIEQALEMPSLRCLNYLINRVKVEDLNNISIDGKKVDTYKEINFGTWLHGFLNDQIKLAINESKSDIISIIGSHCTITHFQSAIENNNLEVLKALGEANKGFKFTYEQLNGLIEQATRNDSPSIVAYLLKIALEQKIIYTSIEKTLDMAVDSVNLSILSLALDQKQFINNRQLMAAITKMITEPKWQEDSKKLNSALNVLCSVVELNTDERLTIAKQLATLQNPEDFKKVFNALKHNLNIQNQTDLFALMKPLTNEQRLVVYTQFIDKIPDIIRTEVADKELQSFMPKIETDYLGSNKEIFAHKSTAQEQEAMRLPLLAFKLALSAGHIEDIKAKFHDLIDIANKKTSFGIRTLTTSCSNIINCLIKEKDTHPIISQALGIDRVDEKTFKNYVKTHMSCRKNESTAVGNEFKDRLRDLTGTDKDPQSTKNQGPK